MKQIYYETNLNIFSSNFFFIIFIDILISVNISDILTYIFRYWKVEINRRKKDLIISLYLYSSWELWKIYI